MLKIYNSLTKKKQVFLPIHTKKVGMYTCGPTVYDHAHIGNLRSYIFADLLFKILTYIEGYKVQWVVNITDIDDKIISKIKSQNGSPQTNRRVLADKYFKLFVDDIKKIGIDIRNIDFVFATKNIVKMRQSIERLVEQGIAYELNGSIYFSIKNYKKITKNKYGVLAKVDTNKTTRISDDQDQKLGIADFALWKAKKDHEPAWSFHLRNKNLVGRPGWHIECSVMSSNELGQPFDIHTGGVDLIFPHHENEIAQSGGKLANYFMHNEHLLVEGHKMSKSLDNYYTLAQIDDPIALRYLCLAVHYQSKMDFSFEAMNAAKQRLAHLRQYCAKLVYNHQRINSAQSKKLFSDFKKALEDNLNSPMALAKLAQLQNSNDLSDTSLKLFKLAEKVFCLNIVSDFKPFNPKEKKLQKQREDARRDGDFKKADLIRQELKELNIETEDLSERTIYWRI